MIAAAESAWGIGRGRLAWVPPGTKTQLQVFVKGALDPGSAAFTDGWEGYLGLDEVGYAQTVKHARNPEQPNHKILRLRE